MKKILFCLLMVVATGCNNQKDTPLLPANVVGQNQGQSEISGKVKFQIREINLPNQYVIHVSWPKEYKNVFVEDNGKKVFEATGNEREFNYTVRDSMPFALRVFRFSEQGINLCGDFSGITPRDFVFNGMINLERETKVEAHRVFVTAGSKIQTNGFRLKIVADKFFSENAEILSFPVGQKAVMNQSGRHGGKVDLLASDAFGHLRINLRGEAGGDGVDGEVFTSRAANGVTGAAGAHDCARAAGVIIRCWCTSSPGPGANGIDGLDGRPGTNSGKGGNSGQIHIEIKNDLGFSVASQLEAGPSGAPGHGGEGQEGGFGGLPGNPTSDACGGSHPGQNGKRGKSGLDGKRPADGIIEKKCISIGPTVRDCD